MKALQKIIQALVSFLIILLLLWALLAVGQQVSALLPAASL